MALLLDFTKAYDSLCREFLILALQLYGFPAAFCAMVAALHSKTTCRFLVNRYLSRAIRVTCGIRQGCPLAPLLFIIALDILYRVIETDNGISGITLRCGSQTFDTKICGYADDTAIYLRTSDDIARAVDILRNFGDVPGLRVNLAKSIGVPLGANSSTDAASIEGIPILANDATCRYLGIQVGNLCTTENNWKLCSQSLHTRLMLASAKSHTVTQRAEIARAIIALKVLFVARYAWPTQATVKKLQRFTKNFVWNVFGTQARRHWIGEQQAELPLTGGGIAMPNITTELLTLSANVIAHWAANATALERLLGDTHLGAQLAPVYITPAPHYRTMKRIIGASLWTTGVTMVEHVHHSEGHAAPATMLRACADALQRSHTNATWNGGGYVIEADAMVMDQLSRIIAPTMKTRGEYCAEWLPYCTTQTNGWLLDRHGAPYRLARTRLAHDTTLLKHLIHWEWISHGVIRFIYVPGQDSATAPTLRSFQQLCYVLLFNFPQLLHRPRQEQVLRPYGTDVQQHHEWHLTTPGVLTHYDATIATTTHTIRTTKDLDYAATSDLNGTRAMRFHTHPATSRLVQVWGGDARWKRSRKKYKRQSAESRATLGHANLPCEHSANDGGALPQTSMQHGLNQVKWKAIHTIPGLSAYERQLLFQLKAEKISVWNRRDNSLECPESTCGRGTQISLEHIFWSCLNAQLRWRSMMDKWSHLGAHSTADSAVIVFSLEIPVIPFHATERLRALIPSTARPIDPADHCKRLSETASNTARTLALERKT